MKWRREVYTDIGSPKSVGKTETYTNNLDTKQTDKWYNGCNNMIGKVLSDFQQMALGQVNTHRPKDEVGVLCHAICKNQLTMNQRCKTQRGKQM